MHRSLRVVISLAMIMTSAFLLNSTERVIHGLPVRFDKKRLALTSSHHQVHSVPGKQKA